MTVDKINGGFMDQELRNKNRLMFLNYNKKRHSELLDYSIILNSQLDWEARDYYLELYYLELYYLELYYLELLDQVVKKKISNSEFRYKFYKKSKINDEVFDLLESKLVLLSPHEKSLDFSNLITEILDYFESSNNDSDSFTENYDSLDNEFRNSMENFYLKMQKYLDE
jgi:hypothetical protein